MGLALVIALICWPFVEIYLAIQVAHQIGGLYTIALLVALSLSGPWLVKRQGLGLWRRAQARAAAGEVPGREATDGFFLVVSGVLLTIPGFLTAALGILLLLPPVRFLLRGATGRRFMRKVRKSNITVRSYSGGRWDESTWASDLRGDGDGAIDAEGRDLPPSPRDLPRGVEPPGDC